MSLKFEVKKKHVVRSERVKCVDLHPDLPWVLSSLYSGSVTIQDYQTQSVVKTIEVSIKQNPVRSAKFLAKKQWIIAASDDLQVRVFNYNTNEKIKTIDAHNDYIRCVVIHPNQSLFLTSSDDTTIKAWDYENNFTLVRTFEDHVNYVMMIALNPRDANTFVSGSVDKTLKVWNIGNSKPNFTLTGHESGINCVDFHRGDKPYLISGGDDRLIKIWDYQTKQCIHTLEAHQQNISGALFHPDLPLIVTCAEDGIIRFWHANTYKMETPLNYNMDRVWSVCCGQDNSIAFGFDEGTVVVKLGQDEPIVSMSQGKVVFAKNFEFFSINLKAQLPNQKELGISDIYPSGVRYSPNGHLFAVYNDQEFQIYRSQNFKNSGFGQGTDLVWSPQGDYAVRDTYSIKMYKNNTLAYEMKTDYQIEGLFQGPLLAAKSGEFVIFYDWDTAKVIRRIDVVPKKIIWNESNTLVALATNEEIYFLQFNPEQMPLFLSQEEEAEGFEEAFEPVYDISESISSGCWVHNLFYFVTMNNRLAYSIGGKVFSVDQDKKYFLLGYFQPQNKLYLMDKSNNIIHYDVNFIVAQFQTLVVAGQFEQAKQLEIPHDCYDKLAKFLTTLNHKEWAYKLATDIDHKFELALQLGLVEDASEIASQLNDTIKYRQVGDLALNQGRIKIAVEALTAGQDYGALLLIYTSLGMKQALHQLAKQALEETKMNIAFAGFFTCADAEGCMQVLLQSKRFAEAAFFAKTYCPSKISMAVKLWKASLQKSHPIIAQKIADPFDYPQQFADLSIALKVEEFYEKERRNLSINPKQYQQHYENLQFDLFTMIKEQPDYDLASFTLQQ